jgi:uncharacterized repeat protein (TIGR01451 family)
MKKMVMMLVVCFIFSTWLAASGTRYNTEILASSANLLIQYSSGNGGGVTTENAAAFGIHDATSNVLEINGLVEVLPLDLSGLSSLNLSGDIYKNVTPGIDYVMKFSYRNRGNNDEDVSFSATVSDVDWAGAKEEKVMILEDSIYEFIVTLNAGVNQVNNYERATVNTLAKLVDPDNVVSYNSFTGAVTLEKDDIDSYGGTDNITNEFTFEVQGYMLAFSTRNVSVDAPVAYGYPAGQPNDVVPGAKLRYHIVFRNDSKAIANDVVLIDKIPADCHLYYTDTPSVNGANSAVWQGQTDNTADENTSDAVKFLVTIPAESTVTAHYSVTID